MLSRCVPRDMARGYYADGVFHEQRCCEDCVNPRYELPMSKALKFDASLCTTCVESVPTDTD